MSTAQRRALDQAKATMIRAMSDGIWPTLPPTAPSTFRA